MLSPEDTFSRESRRGRVYAGNRLSRWKGRPGTETKTVANAALPSTYLISVKQIAGCNVAATNLRIEAVCRVCGVPKVCLLPCLL
jgi:hypothetical protein